MIEIGYKEIKEIVDLAKSNFINNVSIRDEHYPQMCLIDAFATWLGRNGVGKFYEVNYLRNRKGDLHATDT